MGLGHLIIPKLVGRRAPRALRLIHRLVATGIAAAVAMLIVTIAIMQGFWGSYVAAARQFHGDIVMVQEPEAARPEAVLAALQDDAATATITAESPFLLREGLLTGGNGVSGVIIKAIDWELFSKVHPELKVRWEGKGTDVFNSPKDGLPVILGKALVGEKYPTHLFMPTPQHPEGTSIPVSVVGIFESGLYDYDHQFIFVPKLRFAQLLQLEPVTTSGIELRLHDPAQTWRATQVWQNRFPEITITNWSELNRNMFDALRLQRTTFVVLMSLFVIIAISNIVSVVGLQVYFRRRDGAILRLLGVSLAQLRRIIAAATLWTCVLGVGAGAMLGFGIVILLRTTSLISLPESVYFVSVLPIQWNGLGMSLTILGALVISAGVVLLAVRRMATIPILKGLIKT
jgi:lipoprotein-releasing system permease protein